MRLTVIGLVLCVACVTLRAEIIENEAELAFDEDLLVSDDANVEDVMMIARGGGGIKMPILTGSSSHSRSSSGGSLLGKLIHSVTSSSSKPATTTKTTTTSSSGSTSKPSLGNSVLQWLSGKQHQPSTNPKPSVNTNPKPTVSTNGQKGWFQSSTGTPKPSVNVGVPSIGNAAGKGLSTSNPSSPPKPTVKTTSTGGQSSGKQTPGKDSPKNPTGTQSGSQSGTQSGSQSAGSSPGGSSSGSQPSGNQSGSGSGSGMGLPDISGILNGIGSAIPNLVPNLSNLGAGSSNPTTSTSTGGKNPYDEPNPSLGTNDPSTATSTSPFTYYSQYDSKWAKDILGGSSLTIESSGSTVTSLAILLNGFKIPIEGQISTPSSLNKYLSKLKAYTNNGELNWNMIKTLGFEALEPFSSFEEVTSSMTAGNYCILKVGSTWALAVGISGSDYEIIDPQNPYKSSCNSSQVTQARCLARK